MVQRQTIPDRLRPCEPHLKCLLSGAENERERLADLIVCILSAIPDVSLSSKQFYRRAAAFVVLVDCGGVRLDL